MSRRPDPARVIVSGTSSPPARVGDVCGAVRRRLTAYFNPYCGGSTMSAETTRCPKCDGEMVQGFIVDHHGGGKRLVSSWVEGAPEKSFWHSTDVPADKCVPVGT